MASFCRTKRLSILTGHSVFEPIPSGSMSHGLHGSPERVWRMDRFVGWHAAMDDDPAAVYQLRVQTS